MYYSSVQCFFIPGCLLRDVGVRADFGGREEELGRPLLFPPEAVAGDALGFEEVAVDGLCFFVGLPLLGIVNGLAAVPAVPGLP